MMKNYIFGYARVSTEKQSLDRRLDALRKYGVDVIYNEKMTGTKRDRPELEELLDRMTEGNTVVIESLSRLGRSTKDLIELTELFEQEEITGIKSPRFTDISLKGMQQADVHFMTPLAERSAGGYVRSRKIWSALFLDLSP